MENIFESKIPIDIVYASTEFDRLDCEEWKVEINCVPKLRTCFIKKWRSCRIIYQADNIKEVSSRSGSV